MTVITTYINTTLLYKFAQENININGVNDWQTMDHYSKLAVFINIKGSTYVQNDHEVKNKRYDNKKELFKLFGSNIAKWEQYKQNKVEVPATESDRSNDEEGN